MRINFSSENTNRVFSTRDFGEFSQLMYETAMGHPQVEKKLANDKIRQVMFEILGVEPGCKRKELRKAIRRHKDDIFEVIEETVDNLLVSGWQENEFFNEFVDLRNLAAGDRNEFYSIEDIILTVSELSGGSHDLIRQRLNEGESYSIKTSYYGLKIYTEYELFMAGRVDWAGFIQKIYEAMDKYVNDMVYSSVMAAGTKVLPTSQFSKSGALNADTLLTLVEDVQAATGDEVVIMGTRSALAKVAALSDVDWISNSMKEERNTTGRLGIWEGVRLVEIPQRFAPNDATTKLVDPKKLLIMPTGDNKFVKLVYEGDPQIREISDGDTNMDMTMEYEYQVKMGIATVIGKKFGTWTLD